MRGLAVLLQRISADRRGAISVIGAFVLVSVVGVSALALATRRERRATGRLRRAIVNGEMFGGAAAHEPRQSAARLRGWLRCDQSPSSAKHDYRKTQTHTTAIEAQAAATHDNDRDLREKGAIAVEFALVLPLLLLVLLGTVQFGLTLSNYEILTNAVGVGAMQFAISGGASSTPYTDAVNAIENAAPTLEQANLTITLKVNGTACATDATCQTALQGNSGNPAQTSASYPCNLTVMQHNFSPGCRLTATMTERVQ
ncbi:MAG TPA: TadE/TadG family type IV pilus assembly protein [Tepidisphaeraceae bacterium]|jgi:Flp pilus assembly protein TadG|nr:TadE/TadG family type IV pilus assembly protein [Tepidisphaeraceae bacterium]